MLSPPASLRPVAVANYLAQTGVTDIVTLQAAILHDVVEDTCCDIPELEREFGKEVASVVAECTDDTDLNGPDRKRRQVETAPGKSKRARGCRPSSASVEPPEAHPSRPLIRLVPSQTRSNLPTSTTT